MALPAGPKPRNLTALPPDTGPVAWCTAVAGEPPYPWQAEILEALQPRLSRPRVAYVQVPRKNGKTRLAALQALYEACTGDRRHIYAISDSERNLNSVMMREVRDLIGGSSLLRDSVHVYHSHIEVPETGSFIEARPNNFRASQGINPHTVIFDEVHLQKSPDTWSGMQMAGAARPDALLLGVTTPGYDLSGLAHELYQAARVDDPTLFARIWEADPAADIDDREAWAAANPCYHRPGFAAALEFDRSRLPEHEFRRYRMGIWTASDIAWLPAGVWAARAAPQRVVDEGEKVWLGFDGSRSRDSTALVGITADRHIFVAGCWENPGRPSWRVPRDKVEEAVEEAFNRYNVVTLAADPPYWEREIAAWSSRWPGRVVEFPTYSRARMAPACTAFYSAVMEETITHDGDPRMARHISNAIVQTSSWGDYITKPDAKSPAKIDLAVAAIVAHSEQLLTKPGRASKVFVV